jgi:hypothetical protein
MKGVFGGSVFPFSSLFSLFFLQMYEEGKEGSRGKGREKEGRDGKGRRASVVLWEFLPVVVVVVSSTVEV